jgi:hypothetical protein
MVFEKRFLKLTENNNQSLLKISDKNLFYVAYFYTFAKNKMICIGH